MKTVLKEWADEKIRQTRADREQIKLELNTIYLKYLFERQHEIKREAHKEKQLEELLDEKRLEKIENEH